nr:hypothetical protein [Actinomadura sp. WAC 06369]
MLITTAEGAACSFDLAHPKEMDERKQAIHLLHIQQAAPGPCPIVCDKGFTGAGAEKAPASLGHVLIRPVRQDKPARRPWSSPAGCAKRSLIAYDH